MELWLEVSFTSDLPLGIPWEASYPRDSAQQTPSGSMPLLERVSPFVRNAYETILLTE